MMFMLMNIYYGEDIRNSECIFSQINSWTLCTITQRVTINNFDPNDGDNSIDYSSCSNSHIK